MSPLLSTWKLSENVEDIHLFSQYNEDVMHIMKRDLIVSPNFATGNEITSNPILYRCGLKTNCYDLLL